VRSVRELAETCRIAFVVGLCNRDAISQWVEVAIQTRDVPSPELATLATDALDPSELTACLRQLAQDPRTDVAAAPLLGYLYRCLCDDPANLKVVMSVCLGLVRAGALEEKFATRLDTIDDELHLAVEGVYGDLDQVNAHLKNELEQYDGADAGLPILLSLSASRIRP
jgi:hypothetical protein